MESELELIYGNERVVDWFGYWPSFHDAEILWIKMQRIIPIRAGGVGIELGIHFWEVHDRELTKHCLIHFFFEDCMDIRLEGFIFQNVLYELRFKIGGGAGYYRHLKVTLDSSQGLQGNFKCDHVEILKITPCDKDGVPTS
jgi:hypothetical protein